MAKRVYDDAVAMLDDIVKNKRLSARAVVSFCKANSVGDDVELYNESGETVGTLFGLRQQAEKDDGESKYMCQSDFIAPKDSGLTDHIGMFVCTCGHGVDEMCKEFEEDMDDYKVIMCKALADRLAEAFAELLHLKTRKEFWGYDKDEELDTDDLHKVKYTGIRPAPGYPMQPDHTEKSTMWKLMKPEGLIDVGLTESLAMVPAASVSGLYLGHKDSEYMSLGQICKDQIVDYAERKSMKVEEVETWLSQQLSYDV